MYSHRRGAWLGAILGAFVLPALIAAPASAHPYTLSIAPGSVASGSQPALSATFTNKYNTTLGSANLTAPAGFTVVGAALSSGAGTAAVSGNTVQLRNLALAPNKSRSLTVTVATPCTAATSTWTAVVKTGGGFTGDTWGLSGAVPKTTTTGACSTRFVQQPPADVSSGAQFPVKVELLDGAGSRRSSTSAISLTLITRSGGAGTLGGVTSANAVAGLASLSPSITGPDQSVYALQASSPGSTTTSSSTSIDTEVHRNVTVCTEDADCQAFARNDGVVDGSTPYFVSYLLQAFADGGIDATTLFLDFNVGPALDCDLLPGVAYDEVSPDTVVWDGARRGKRGTLTMSKSLLARRNILHPVQMQFCYGGPYSFTTWNGTAATAEDFDGNGTADRYKGLLPACVGPVFTPPCIVDRQIGGDGNGVVVVDFPDVDGDPYGRG